MPTKLSTIESKARERLIESTPRFWSSSELIGIINDGIKDLWRDVVELKQEHFIKEATLTLYASTGQITSVPLDVHKVYHIGPLDVSSTSATRGLRFEPRDYNSADFQGARRSGTIDPAGELVYYTILNQGGPVEAPIIKIAPQVNSDVELNFVYVPTLHEMTADNIVPIPGEADNALIAWTVAYARAKESEDRSPDANWLSIYATEKQHILVGLGTRQHQEPEFAEAMFSGYW